MSKQGVVWLWRHSHQQSYGLAAKSCGMTSNESFYLRLKMNIRLREISAQLNIRKCFFEHESHKSDESFSLRLKMNIRLIRDISVQLNICECIFFSNTNRTNLTNLLGCDMVYIRGIREICGQLNIRECFFRTRIARI